MRKFFIGLLAAVTMLAVGCAGNPIVDTPQPQKVEVEITIKQTGDNQVTISADDGTETISKGMEIVNPGLQLSSLGAIANDTLIFKIFSGLSVADVTRLFNDLIYIENEEPGIKDVTLFIDSPGGDAFSGLALSDLIEKYQGRGYRFTAVATGIIASAAVPVFTVCDETHATAATIFMVHEAALWKWPGRESASDIRTQGRLMDLLQLLYLDKLVKNSNLNFTEWATLEGKTSWFSVRKAAEMGILDFINDTPAMEWVNNNPLPKREPETL